MRIVLDTNVFVSGIFFSGPPSRILHAWRDEQLRLVYSAAILEEYQRVLLELSRDFQQNRVPLFLDLVSRYGELVLPEAVKMEDIACRDPADLKFIECLLHSKSLCLVTGDKDLLEANVGTAAILTPRKFCDLYL